MSARRLCLAVCATILAASVSLSGQSPASHPDFTGRWKMDTTKFDKHDAELAGLTLTVSNHGDTLLVVTDVVDAGRPPVQMRSTYLPNLPRPAAGGSPADTLARMSVRGWVGDTLVLRRVEKRPDRTLEIEERWTLDASGRTLSRSQTAVDGIRWSRQTLLFTRQ